MSALAKPQEVAQFMFDSMREVLTDLHGEPPSNADVVKAAAGAMGWPLADTEEAHEAEMDRLLGPKEHS